MSGSSARGPFLAFGVVALIAAVGAVYEISYWIGVSAFAGPLLGTTAGILIALAAFFVWGLLAPANE